jgi:hypothetical protein
MSVNLANWTVQDYLGISQANWQLETDGLSVLQTRNSAPSLFCSAFFPVMLSLKLLLMMTSLGSL